MSVRLARVGEGDAVARLCALVGPSAYAQVLGQVVDGKAELLLPAPARVFVKVYEDRVVGMLWVNPHVDVVDVLPKRAVQERQRVARVCVKVEALAVDAEFRSRGFGTELLVAVENRCAAMRVHTVALDVDKGNAVARGFFVRRGFRAVPAGATVAVRVGSLVVGLSSAAAHLDFLLKVRSVPQVYTSALASIHPNG